MDPAPRSLSIAAAAVAFLWYALAAVAGVGVIPPARMPIVLAALAVLHGLQAFLPALWGRAPVPQIEPPRIGDAAVKVGVVLLALILTGCDERGAMVAGTVALPLLAMGTIALFGRRLGWFLLVALLALPAHAEEPRPAVAPVPVQIAPVVQPPPAPLTDAERIALAVRAAQAGLIEAQRGIAASPALRSWSETRAGQAVLGCIAGAIVVTSAAGSVAGVWAVSR